MADLIFESIRACVLLYAFFFLVRTGKKHAELCQTGWNYLILGFGLLCFGNIIDITDNFDSLDQFIVIGDTPAQAFLEKMVGFLGGFLFVTIGLIKWIPTITSVEHNKQLNRDLEQAIQKSNLMAAEAEMANVAKSEFLANMSHEIRTPMNGVIGMTNLLLGSELSPEQREFAVTIHNSADALLDIINDILDYSKIEAGKIELEEIDFDLRVTIEALDDLIAVKAQEKGLEYVTNIHPDVPLALVGDPGRLRQILMNLAGNAVKFTPRGEVAVSITLEDKDTSSATLRFSVRDTGIGIPEKSIDTLFDSFSQADSSTTREFGGTGLGLAISKQLCKLMGGEINIKSREGKGSEFWFTAVFKRQAAPKEKNAPLPGKIKGKRILIVDDNKTSRHVLEELLTFWECGFESVSGGSRALTELSRAVSDNRGFDIAILDMHMPEMDGAELGKKIKQDPALKETRLVLMTAMGAKGDKKRFEEIGFAAYLSKPVKPLHLYECLSAVAGSPPSAGTGKENKILTRYTLNEDRNLKFRILLAEDNKINQKVALATLRRLGYTADLAGDGKEAVRALEKNSYDMVLMDCRMPGMDGYEATEKIRAPGSKVLDPGIPVIALTANATKADMEKCLKAGMNDFMAKPFKPHILDEMLKKWLPGNGKILPADKTQVP